MKILCTICARGGSKGVINKNIRLIEGKPLIAYSIEQAKQSKLFEHIVISTDSDEIAEVAKKYGAEVFFKRPAHLAEDTSPKIPVIRHAFESSEAHYKEKFDVLVDLDATSPLRTYHDIIEAFNMFKHEGADNLITAMPSRKSPYFNIVEISPEGKINRSKPLPQAVTRRQDAPQCYDLNASIYIWKRDILLTQNTLYLDKTALYVMPEERSFDIDTETDFKIVECLLKERK